MAINNDQTLFGEGGKAISIHDTDHGNSKHHTVPHVHDHKEPDRTGMFGSPREPTQSEREMIDAARESID